MKKICDLRLLLPAVLLILPLILCLCFGIFGTGGDEEGPPEEGMNPSGAPVQAEVVTPWDINGSDSTAFETLQSLEAITAQGDDGSLALTNNGTEDCSHAAVYYKLLYDDGAYLGGITYRVSVTDLPAGESRTITAGHYYVNAAEIVGIAG